MSLLKRQRGIDEALRDLKALVEETVRAEQLVDRLSGLGNNEALDAWIQYNLDQDKGFWLAFVEVDRFKSVNDEFGYDAADELLRRIAEQLKNASNSFFGEGATPFRAHGDEFYIGGVGDESDVGDALDQIRSAISSIRLKPPDHPSSSKVMRATVSVGWATNQDALSAGVEVLTVRAFRGVLEAAVAAAKAQRDCVLRFEPAHQKSPTRSGRADCAGCQAKFEIRIPVTDARGGEIRCPNCGSEMERPISLKPEA